MPANTRARGAELELFPCFLLLKGVTDNRLGRIGVAFTIEKTDGENV